MALVTQGLKMPYSCVPSSNASDSSFRPTHLRRRTVLMYICVSARRRQTPHAESTHSPQVVISPADLTLVRFVTPDN